MSREQVRVHRGTHDGGNDASITGSLVSSVAAVAGVEPTALPPLQDTVDTDALEAILGTAQGDGTTVTFTYAGYRVVADSDGSVRIEESIDGR